MNFEMSSEQQEFCDHFRKFCDKEIAPYSYEWEQAGRVPQEVFRKLGDIGYTGLLMDVELGGQNASMVDATLAQVIISEACGSTFFSVGASFGLFGHAIHKNGTEKQRQKYVTEVMRGDKVGALGVTEPQAGSDVNGLTTTAKEVADGYILNGQKTYITNAPICDYAVILARLEDASGKQMGLTHFIVHADTPGFTKGKAMQKMGLKASPTGEIFLEDCKIPKENLLGKHGRGFRQTMEVFNGERLSLAAYSVGVMQACLDESKSYAKTRKAFGKSINKHQSVAFMLSDMMTKLEASKILLYSTAWNMDRIAATGGKQSDVAEQSAIVKLLASTHAREVTNLAVQLHGGAGYMEEYKVCRLYRDIKLAEIGGGTSEIQESIIARAQEKRYAHA